MGESAGDEKKVLIVRGALAQPHVYVERVRTDAADDSGWHVGPADFAVPAGEYDAAPLAELLAARPDLRELLRLPPGWLAVLRDGEVEAVLDDANHDVWAATQAVRE